MRQMQIAKICSFNKQQLLMLKGYSVSFLACHSWPPTAMEVPILLMKRQQNQPLVRALVTDLQDLGTDLVNLSVDHSSDGSGTCPAADAAAIQ